MSAMCPDRPLQGQGGFSLVSAIFLLLVLAALGAYMVTVAGVQHTTAALDLQGARAYQAARAGIEWGAYQVLRPAAAGPCPASPTALTLGGTLAGFAVAVQCVSYATTEGGNNVNLYQITSTASFGTVGGVDYVERQLQATYSR